MAKKYDGEKELIRMAATLSGKPAKEISLDEALRILQLDNPREDLPIIGEALNIIWDNVTTRQLRLLLKAEKTNDCDAAYSAFMRVYAEEHPDFDIEAWQEAVEKIGGYEVFGDLLKRKISRDLMETAGDYTKLQERLAELTGLAVAAAESVSDALPPVEDLTQEIVTTAKAALTEIRDFMQSPEYETIKESLHFFRTFIEQNEEEFAAFAGRGEVIQKLIPFIKIELQEAKNNPEFANLTLIDIVSKGMDKHGNPTKSKFAEIIERAKQRRAEHEAAAQLIAETEQAAEDLPRIIASPADTLSYPLDKPNSKIWNLLAAADPSGQIKLEIDTSRRGSKQDAIIYYGLNFDDPGTGITITKNLTPFDKRVYIAAAALFNAGNKIISTRQIFREMGQVSEPQAGDKRLKDIDESLTKMGAARVYIDNEREAKATKGGYDHFRYDASLLPFERINAYINGQLTEGAIHLFREPPMISFARQRKQITTIPRQLLESPISKTEANLRLEDYLIERIGRMKSDKGKAHTKILFQTIYEKCGIVTAKQKQRAPEKIRRLLDYYKTCEWNGKTWIKDYTEDKDGITIIV